MTIKSISELEKRIAHELQAFVIKGPLLIMNPVDKILKAIYFERSSYEKSAFSVTFFAMILCVPAKNLSFNFGSRVRHKGGGDRWNLSMPNLLSEIVCEIKNQALPFLSEINSPLDFAHAATAFSGNPHTPKAVAFSLARAGQDRQAIAILDELLGQLDPKISWHQIIANQAESLRNKLSLSPTDAQRQLEDWEAETIHNLGLE